MMQSPKANMNGGRIGTIVVRERYEDNIIYGSPAQTVVTFEMPGAGPNVDRPDLDVRFSFVYSQPMHSAGR